MWRKQQGSQVILYSEIGASLTWLAVDEAIRTTGNRRSRHPITRQTQLKRNFFVLHDFKRVRTRGYRNLWYCVCIHPLATRYAMRASPSKIDSTPCGKKDPLTPWRRPQIVFTGIRLCTETPSVGGHALYSGEGTRNWYKPFIKPRRCSSLSLRLT